MKSLPAPCRTDHRWVSIPSWIGRYYCQVCGVRSRKDLRTGNMIPYQCSQRGCSNPVQANHMRKMWCREHTPALHLQDAVDLLNP